MPSWRTACPDCDFFDAPMLAIASYPTLEAKKERRRALYTQHFQELASGHLHRNHCAKLHRAPTGTVTFRVGGNRHATVTTSKLAVGMHSVSAIYQGDTNFNSSTSAAHNQVVKK